MALHGAILRNAHDQWSLAMAWIAKDSDSVKQAESDSAGLSDSEAMAIQAIATDHWSWAFRQIALWRAMLMDGA